MHWRARVREAVAWLDRVATPGRILLAGWLLFLIYAYPGYMSYDSVTQLAQARNVEPMNEWHPPLMAFIWHFLDEIMAGPVLMLVLQSVAFLLGTYVLVKRVMSRRAAALFSAVFLLVPQNIVVMAVIWKDSQMAGYLLAGIAALLAESRRWRVFGCVLIFAATGVRYNAPAATLPIVVLLFQWSPRFTGWRRYALSTAVWIVITATAFKVNGMLVEKKLYPFQTATAMADIAGTLRFVPDITTEEVLRLTEGVPWAVTEDIPAHVRKAYSHYNTFLDLIAPPRQLFEYPTTQAHRDAFEAAWKRVIRAYPKQFLWHRLRVFRGQLRPPAGIYASFINADWGEDLVKHRAIHSALQAKWVRKMDSLSASVLFRVLIYFWVAFLLLPLCRERIPFMLFTSGILHELALYIVAPAIDYRYSHWLVCAAILGALFVLLSRLRRAKAPKRVVSGEDLG